MVFDYNRYLYVRGNPLKYTDPSGHGPETIWDIINIGIGIASLSHNVSQGNWGDAAWDAGGILVDAAATMVPMVPGGASSAIRAKRLAAAAKWAPAEAEISQRLQRVIMEVAAETPGMEIAVFGRAPGANALEFLYEAKPPVDGAVNLRHGVRQLPDGRLVVSDLDLAVVTINGVPASDEFVEGLMNEINKRYGYRVVKHTDQYNGELLNIGIANTPEVKNKKALAAIYRFSGKGYGGSSTFGAYRTNNIFAYYSKVT